MAKRRLLQDFLILCTSLLLAWAIVYYEWVTLFLHYSGESLLLSSFVAGIFFTSLVTTPPALAMLGVLVLQGDPAVVAFFGGLGAVIGDYIIFLFVRDRLSDDIAYMLKHTGTPRFFKIFHRRSFKRLLPFLGGLIIASPLPDELGLALLGVAKLPTSRFIVISFAFNTIGILCIGLAVRAVAL